jgi:hypothetical protein
MLYKYMSAIHASSFLGMGVVRIGTLYDFRRVEAYGDKVGDHDEGTLSYRFPIGPEGLAFTAEDQPDFLKGSFKLARGARLTLYTQGEFIRRRDTVPDCYVFSMSNRADAALMREFGRDTCVRIDEPAGFFAALSTCVPGEFLGVHACRYRDRTRDGLRWRNDADANRAALIKDAQYANQGELRALWRPYAVAELAPFRAMHHALGRFCSRVNLA